MRKLLFIFILFATLHLSARQVVTGKVVDKETSNPLPGTSVELLLMPDSSMVEVAVTNTEGTFMLYKADTLKSYCLRFKFLGYQTSVNPLARKSGRVNNAGLVKLDVQVIGMKEIIIGSSKVRVTELADRTVYSIPEDMKKTSTDGLDVLRKLPSVQIDYYNEDIAVEGKTNIKIEVDGITRSKEYLKKLHPSQIDKSEIITAPAGKYDSEVDAVINVITKKEMRYGLKGSVHANGVPNLEALDPHMGNMHLNFDYGLKKISYYISGGGWTNNMEFINTMDRTTGNSLLNRDGSQQSSYKGGYYNMGFNYEPNELNNINFDIGINPRFNQSKGNQLDMLYNLDTLRRMNRTLTNTDGSGGDLRSTLYYKHKYDKVKQHYLEFETNFSQNINNENNVDYQNVNYDLVSGLPIDSSDNYFEKSTTKRQTISGQLNYNLPLDSIYTFGTGVNSNLNVYDLQNEMSVTNAPDLQYTDWRASAFIELSRTVKWGNVKLGTKLETSNVTINKSSQDPYLSFLPYVSGQYKINDNQSVKLNYTRRVIRPSTGQLNPLESSIDSLTISKGNIDLDPAYRDNVKLTYNIKFGKKKFTGNLSPQVYYEYRTKLIQRISRLSNDGSNKVISMPENISNGYEYGAGLSANMQIFVVMMNTYLGYTYNHIDSYKDQIDELNRHGWNCNANIMSPLPKNFRIFSNIGISSPYVNGQEISKRSPFYMFGLMKQFENNSSVRIMIFNPFADRLFENSSTIRNSVLDQRTMSYMNIRNAVMIGYSYNFKVGKDIKSKNRNDDQNGDGNMNFFSL